ncbi:MAG: CDP-alcohol phosphatidyltransferase family protein [Actinomycetota bacterium]
MAEQRGSEISSRIFTIPNILSFLRLLLVPVFFVAIVLGQDQLAFWLLIASSVTDFVDGQIARRFNQISRLGQLLDPAADRLLILAALIGLTVRDVVPLWLFIVIVARDVMLIVLGIILANNGYGPLPVHHIGKFATFCLFFAIPILMLGLGYPVLAAFTVPIGWGFLLWGAFVYWWAGVIYLMETIRVIRLPISETAP